MSPLVLALVALAAAAVLVPRLRHRRARRRQLALLAMTRRWTYTPADPWDLPAEIEGLWLGAWGHDRRCRDVFSVPMEVGALWLCGLQRQMSSGRYRRTERFALAVIRLTRPCGGLAILLAEEWFRPVDPFVRYRAVEPAPPGRQAWAERPATDGEVLGRLTDLVDAMPPTASIEVRGDIAVVYWPVADPLRPADYASLDAAAGRLLAAVSIERAASQGL